MPIRILHVIAQMNRAGIENLLMGIYRNIDLSKVQFDFYTHRDHEGYFDSEIIAMGGKVYYNPSQSIRHIHKNCTHFTEFLRRHPQYRIVHCHMNAWCGPLLWGAKIAGVPVRIAHSHTALNKVKWKNVGRDIIKLPVNRYATHRLAVSRKAGVWLYGTRYDRQGKVQVWPNAIEHHKFRYNLEVRQEIRHQWGMGDNYIIIHVGNFRFEKNHAYLLKVFEQVKSKDDSARLVLVGDGNCKKLRTEAEQLGVADSVMFTGARSDVNRLLQAADIMVFPSLYEGMPVAVLEAQAAGLPCIISDGITEEVCITPLIQRMPLSLGPGKWADMVLNVRTTERTDTGEYFVNSGFDITSLVGKLTEFYLQVSNQS